MAGQNKDIQSKLSANDKHASGRDQLHALISDCIARNRNAQKMLYDRFSPVAYGIIKRYEYNEQIAQEILNDSFYKIFTKLEQYSFQGPFEGWVRRIIVNTVTDHIRKNMKHESMVKGELKMADAYIESDSISKLTYKELLQLIHALPETQRAVFNLTVFEDLSHKEIGELLKMNENNSRWYLNDARKRLKEAVKSMK